MSRGKGVGNPSEQRKFAECVMEFLDDKDLFITCNDFENLGKRFLKIDFATGAWGYNIVNHPTVNVPKRVVSNEKARKLRTYDPYRDENDLIEYLKDNIII